MALFKRRVGSISGLTDLLGSKLEVSSIAGAKADVEKLNSIATIPSTAALNEIVAGLSANISKVQSSVGGLIDDTAVAGGSVSWSVDKIKAFVASVDDSVVVENISARDDIENPHETLIAYVLDTTGDTSLGDDEGKSVAYIYVNGAWKVMQILATHVDTTPFVKYTDIVNDLTTGGKAVPLSAEQGKALKALVDAAAVSTEMFVDTGLAITGDDFKSTHTPIGAIVGATAEVEVSDGVWDIVDVTAGSDAKSWVLVPVKSGDYDKKTCRITYLKASSEA